eukprot:3889952-Pleurochrysis_carterae.AAC.4
MRAGALARLVVASVCTGLAIEYALTSPMGQLSTRKFESGGNQGMTMRYFMHCEHQMSFFGHSPNALCMLNAVVFNAVFCLTSLWSSTAA